MVPAGALRADAAASGVSVLIERSGRVEQRSVSLGLRTLDAAEVLGGLAAGDTVLIGPAPEPGRRVRADTSAAPGPAATLPKTSREDAGSAMSNAMGR